MRCRVGRRWYRLREEFSRWCHRLHHHLPRRRQVTTACGVFTSLLCSRLRRRRTACRRRWLFTTVTQTENQQLLHPVLLLLLDRSSLTREVWSSSESQCRQCRCWSVMQGVRTAAKSTGAAPPRCFGVAAQRLQRSASLTSSSKLCRRAPPPSTIPLDLSHLHRLDSGHRQSPSPLTTTTYQVSLW